MTRLILFAWLTAAGPTFAAPAVACDPARGDLPGVILIGEDHAVPSSIDVRFTVAAAAARGVYPAAIEPMGQLDGRRVTTTGSFLTGDEARVTARFGGRPATSLLRALEAPVPYAVFFSYFFRIDQMNRRLPAFVVAMNIVDFARDLPLFARALNAVPGPLAAALRTLRANAAYARLGDQAKIEYVHARFAPQFSLDDFDRFAAAHHAEVVRLANFRHADVFGPAPLPVLATPADRERFGCVGTPCEPTGRLRRLFIDHRDHAFADRVAEQLCTHAGRWSHVVVDVGHAHLPGLAAELRRRTRARIETYRSDHGEDLARLNAALARIKTRGPAPTGR